MTSKGGSSILTAFALLISGAVFISVISSCGKSNTTNAAGLNIEYEVLNLSPDLYPVNLYINYTQTNKSPFVFSVYQGYFYLQSISLPFQIRTALTVDTTIFSRLDTLTTATKYSLFITGTQADHSIKQIFTVDTGTTPGIGRGKVRFLNASPTGAGGLDLYANGTPAFTKIPYTTCSPFIELPVGNYDFQVQATGTTSVIKDMPGITIQDGRLYTIYAYGYTTRIDTAAFNAGIITNK